MTLKQKDLMNYEGCFRKVRKLITKPNEVSP